VPVGAAPAWRVDDPADQDRDEHEAHEPDDQRPVHGGEHYTPGPRDLATPGTDTALHAGVHRDLLTGGRERPRDLESAVLPEHEPQLAWRPQTIRVVGSIRSTRARVRHGTEVVLMEEAVLAAHLHAPRASVRHPVLLRKARPRRHP